MNHDGKAEIIQLWNNHGLPCMTIFGDTGNNVYQVIFSSGDMEVPSYKPSTWLTSDVNGNGEAEIIQLWKNP